MTSSQEHGKKGMHLTAHPKEGNRKLGVKALGPQDLIRRVQLGLSDDQYELLREMMHFTNQTTEQYVTHSIKWMLAADVDQFFKMGDSRREPAFKVLEGKRK